MSNLYEIKAIVDDLQAHSKKKDKEAILTREMNNEDFKKFIQYAFDPLLKYGLQDKKLKKFLGKETTKTQFNNIFEVYEFLLINNTGTDKVAEIVANYINSNPDDLQEFLTLAICKKLRVGASSTFNKVYGKGFLNFFELMLAKKFEEESHKVVGKEFAITEKFDGQRCAVFVSSKGINAYTREGNLIKGMNEIEEELSHLPDGVYDGELLCDYHATLKDRAVLQETLKITRKNGIKTGVLFYVFDYVPLDEFADGKSKDNYLKRREVLSNSLTRNEKFIHLVPILYLGKDLEVIPDMLLAMEDKGKEGLMLNLTDEPYLCKRSENILKLKTMQTADLRIIDFEQGKPMGKYKDTLGNFVVDYKGYRLGVSGISDKVRDEVWNNQSDYLGVIIEVSHFRESQNEKGGLSVSFAQFKGFRYDKEEPSYY